MVFANLAERLQETFRKLRGHGRLTEKDVDAALREVRLALLEADVNFKVVKDFIATLKERAMGQEVLRSLTPGQQVIKIVNEELTRLMGGTQSRLATAPKPPTVVLLVGLQGAGKTTTAGKLALYLKSQGRRPLLVAGDVYRPAAVRQLEIVGEKAGVPVFTQPGSQDPVAIARAGVAAAAAGGHDYVLIDTAGRLQIDEEMMGELVRMRQEVKPHEVLLIVDAMTGQEAVNVAATFHEKLSLDGVILTKLDGDARGGAALSIKAVTHCPIKFAAMGEKLEALEPFHPDRMASRILGMGDVLSLIEKAEAQMSEERARELEAKLRRAEFTLEDFLEQLQAMRKMGPLEQLLGMLPGMGGVKGLKDLQVDEGELKHIEAMIYAMTPEERRHPEMIDGSRRRRIARGSGTQVQDLNRLLKQFEQTQRLMKQLSGMSGGGWGLPGLGRGRGKGLLPAARPSRSARRRG